MRYIVINESVSAHCCFEATVVDTQTPGPDRGRTVCECFSRADAERVARALNAEEDAVDQSMVDEYAAATYEQAMGED
jgi:hypothetical protein